MIPENMKTPQKTDSQRGKRLKGGVKAIRVFLGCSVLTERSLTIFNCILLLINLGHNKFVILI